MAPTTSSPCAWAIVSSAGRHGTSQRWVTPDGVHWSRESLHLRGFVHQLDRVLDLLEPSHRARRALPAAATLRPALQNAVLFLGKALGVTLEEGVRSLLAGGLA